MRSLFRFYDENEVEEMCGFILDKRRCVQLKNVHPEPTEGFEIDPEDTLRYLDRIKGIWHTHPNEPAVLSGHDKLCMEMWPDIPHYIIGSDGIRKYVVKDGAVVNANYTPR